MQAKIYDGRALSKKTLYEGYFCFFGVKDASFCGAIELFNEYCQLSHFLGQYFSKTFYLFYSLFMAWKKGIAQRA